MNPFGIEVYHSKRIPRHVWAMVAIGIVGVLVIWFTR